MELAEWRDAHRHESSGEAVLIRYLDWCREQKGLSPQTLRSYTSTLSAWVVWTPDVLAAQLDDMEQFLLRPRERRGKGRMGSPATRRREASCLRAFYRWTHRRNLTPTNPAEELEGPTVHNTNPRPLSDAQWRRLWLDDRLTDGERLMLGCGFYLGLRRAEMVDLQGANITSTRLRDFPRKGGGEDTLPWAEVVGVYVDHLPQLSERHAEFERLMRDAAKVSGPVLPWVSTADPNTVNKRMCLLQKRLDVPEGDWVTPHQLRHSCATNLLRAGVPIHLVSRILNHSSTAITMRYVKAGGAELREWRSRGNG